MTWAVIGRAKAGFQFLAFEFTGAKWAVHRFFQLEKDKPGNV
jgi:hypothetical protein